MEEYILAVDTGNTNTVVGLFTENPEHEIVYHWRTVSRRERTSDELGIFILGFLQMHGIPGSQIKGYIYSSVLPSFNPIIERMTRDYFGCEAIRVSTKIKLPFKIDYPRPEEIGADRLVNAAAGVAMYGGDLIIIDMGTATTFCVIRDGRYLGGSIAPGLKLSIEALSRNTAQLPPIEFARPESGVVGNSTIRAIQSGFFFGWTGILREIRDRIREEYPDRPLRVVATGGLSSLIGREVPELFDEVDSQLTLRGLKILYEFQTQAG